MSFRATGGGIILLAALGAACGSSSQTASPPPRGDAAAPVTAALELVHVDYTSCTVSVTIDVAGAGYLRIRRASDPVTTREALLAETGHPLAAGVALQTSFDTLTPATDYDVDFIAATNDGVVQASVQSLAITTLLPNQPPTITLGGELRLDTDPGAVSLPGWATDIAPGPASESSQSLTANLTVQADWPLAFDVAPTFDVKTGDLAFTVTKGTYGYALLTLTLHDDGGTDSGGVDTTVVSFSLEVNIPPVAYNVAASGPWGSPCIPFTLQATDDDGDVGHLVFDVTSLPSHGHIVDTAPQQGDGVYSKPVNGQYGPTIGRSFCYVPDSPTFLGVDSLAYDARDSRGGTSPAATVLLTVQQ